MLIYDAIKQDHIKVKRLLGELVRIEDGAKNRHDLIEKIRDELIPHARAEEAVLYNSIRALDSAKSVVGHAYQEHIEAESLLRALQLQDIVDAGWRETAMKLKKSLEHHIQEEEEKVLPTAQQLFTDEEAEIMAKAFEALKPEVRKEGFVQTTLELLVNMMPASMAPRTSRVNLESRI